MRFFIKVNLVALAVVVATDVAILVICMNV